MTFNRLPPKYAAVILLVASPYYIWLWISLYYHALPDLRIVGMVFLVWLFIGYFIVKAIFKRMNENWHDKQ